MDTSLLTRNFDRAVLWIGGVSLLLLAGVVWAEKPSVLFINVDDWNDWNEVLQGHPQAITPHITRLAERGVTFSNAICARPPASLRALRCLPASHY